MNLATQMNRFTHESKNIKSMIANVKSELRGQEKMKKSKSGLNFASNHNMDSNGVLKFERKNVSMKTGKNG